MLGPDGPDEFADFNGYRPPAKRSEIDTFDERDAASILDDHHHRWGDPERNPGSWFPFGWTEADVVEWLHAVMDSPSDAWELDQPSGAFTLRGAYRGVTGVIHIHPTGSGGWIIASGYPKRVR